MKSSIYEEGLARIIYNSNVFLNPKAKLNRDISVVIAKEFFKGRFSVLDATSATGIRAIRYAKEANADPITVLDINEDAIDIIHRNLSLNNVNATVIRDDIRSFSLRSDKRFNLIDIDPFGSPALLVNSAFTLASKRALLFVTATDTAVLCGNKHRAALKKYNAITFDSDISHEVGARILIYFIARIASQYNFGIEPLAVLSYNTYIRLYLKIERGDDKAMKSIESYGFFYKCNECGNQGLYTRYNIEQRCSVCNSRVNISGPLWIGKLFNERESYSDALKDLASTYKANEWRWIIKAILEELDIPFYYYLPEITSRLKKGSISIDKLIELLRSNGYMASRTHFNKSAIKCSCSYSELKGIISDLKV